MAAPPAITPLEQLNVALFDDAAILKKLASSSRQLAELKGLAASIPNQGILINGKTIPVVVGWDRRTGQCHLGVSDINLDDEDCEGSEFDPVLEAGAKGLSRGLQVSTCRAILADAGIVAPKGTFELLEEHISLNAGKLVVRIDADGTQTVLWDEEKVAFQSPVNSGHAENQ